MDGVVNMGPAWPKPRSIHCSKKRIKTRSASSPAASATSALTDSTVSISGSNSAARRGAVRELKWEQREAMVQYLQDDVKSCSDWLKEDCASYEESVTGHLKDVLELYKVCLEEIEATWTNREKTNDVIDEFIFGEGGQVAMSPAKDHPINSSSFVQLEMEQKKFEKLLESHYKTVKRVRHLLSEGMKAMQLGHDHELMTIKTALDSQLESFQTANCVKIVDFNKETGAGPEDWCTDSDATKEMPEDEEENDGENEGKDDEHCDEQSY